MTRRTKYVILIVAAVALFLPFASKPPHMDGALYYSAATRLAADPWHLYSENALHDGKSVGVFESFPHPPLYLYYLAGLRSVGLVENEQRVAWAALPFSILFILSVAWLSESLGVHSIWPAIFVLLSPVYLIMSSNIMTDLPVAAAVTFGLAGVIKPAAARFGWQNVLLCLGLSAAVMTRYHAVAFVVLLLVLALASRKRKPADLWYLIVPLAVAFAQQLYTSLAYGEPHILAVSRQLSGYDLDYFANAIYSLVSLSTAALPLGALCVVVLIVRRSYGVLVGIAAASLLFGLFYQSPFVPEDDLSYRLQMAAALGAGISAVWLVFSIGRHSLERRLVTRARGIRDDWWLPSAFFLASLVLIVFTLPFGAARYLLPMIPAAMVIAFRRLTVMLRSRRSLAVVIGLLVIPAGTLGMASAAADHQLAKSYDGAVAAVAARSEESDILFSGEGDFRRACERQGGRYLLTDDAMPEDAILLTSHLFPPAPLADSLWLGLSHVNTETIAVSNLKTCSDVSFAGFYGHRWGMLPFQYDPSADDRIYAFARSKGYPLMLEIRESDSSRALESFEIGGWIKHGFSVHPPDTVVIQPPDSGHYELRFVIGMNPVAWTKGSDGFNIDVMLSSYNVGSAPHDSSLASGYMSPTDPVCREWVPIDVLFPVHEPARSSILVITDAGPSGDAQYDWAVMAEAELVTR